MPRPCTDATTLPSHSEASQTSGSRIAAVPVEIVRGIRDLEPLPVTAQRLFELVNGREVSLATIAELIEVDQAVAAAVLRRACTVRYATRTIPTVRDAVFRLGTIAVLNLVLDKYMARLRTAAPMYDLTEHELWLHGAATQLAVRALRAERPQLRIPELTETAALMHDIGKLIVARYLKADVREILTRAHDEGKTFVEAERAILGTDHAEVGAAVAEHWEFPPEIVDTIQLHHAHAADPTVMLDAVVVANVAAKTIQAGLGAEGLNVAVDPGTCSRLNLDFPAFARICLQTEEWLRELEHEHGLR